MAYRRTFRPCLEDGMSIASSTESESSDESADDQEEKDDDRDGELGYRVVRNTPGRAQGRLLDKEGYSYVIKRRDGTKIEWWCALRDKHNKCAATVLQMGKKYRPGPPHAHPPHAASPPNIILSVTDEICTSSVDTKGGDKVPGKNIDVSVYVDADQRPLKHPNLGSRGVRSEDRENEEAVHTVIKGASRRGNDMLVDPLGYTFTIKHRGRLVTHWRCNKRSKKIDCVARIIQKGNKFHHGQQDHNHPPQPGIANKLIATAKIKSEAKGDTYKPASAIIDSVMEYEPGEEGTKINPNNLKRIIHRVRKNLESQHTQGSQNCHEMGTETSCYVIGETVEPDYNVEECVQDSSSRDAEIPVQPNTTECTIPPKVIEKMITSEATQKFSSPQKLLTKQQTCSEYKSENVLHFLSQHLSSLQKEDECDAIGKMVAAKLRKLPNKIRIYTERLISEVLCEAELGNISNRTRISTSINVHKSTSTA